jgi:TonB family protein
MKRFAGSMFALALAASPAMAESPPVSCAATVVTDGCGTYAWPDGSRYVGGFKAGSFEGEGALTYTDGSVLEGQFHNSTVIGEATYTTQTGAKLVGPFQDGDKDPARTYPLPDFPFWRGVFGDEASIQVSITVGEDGRVLSAKIDTPSKYDSFNQSAVDTIRQWVYRPATIDGTPVKTLGIVKVRFAQPGSPFSQAS